MDLKEQDILQEFIDAKAILKGHFKLSSGLHSDTYMQCARILMCPIRAQKLCQQLAKNVRKRISDDDFDIVLAPAMGGVVVGYEMGRQLGKNTIFCERVDSKFQLRRGFELEKDARVLVVEDVITTGKSSLETYDLVRSLNANVVAQCCLVDRSNDENLENKMAVPIISLLKVEVKTFSEDNIPNNLRNIDVTKPGSRFLAK